LSDRAIRYAITARVSMQLDSTVVEGAEVKVISFASDDIDCVSDKNGIVGFNIPVGSAYIAVARKNEYTGVYMGISEKTGDGSTVTIHPIVVKNNAGAVPVLGFVSDESGQPLSTARAVVTDNNTGEPVDVRMVYGILSFDGKKGVDYKIEIAADDYESQTEGIKIDPQASNIQILEINVTRRKLMALPAGASLIVVNNENPRVYITSQESHDEIVEDKGTLYLQSTEGTKPIGIGSLQTLLEKPSRLMALSDDQIVRLDNIYFDFNSALLDQADQQVLEKVRGVIVQYPLLKLLVNAHADTRGSANYNLGLSRKRARAIRRHLVKQGLRSRHISIRAYGKSVPVVICNTKECSEQQHQRNRRAEFELAALRKTKLEPLPVVKPQPAKDRVKATYAELLAKYGDRQMDDLVFKVCIGAYRLNPDLTFQELTDLGNITKRVKGGVYYYYLQDFPTLKTAESIRQQVIQRGIADAYITIFYKGNKVSFPQFISLTE
jgi:outer membrane protein OmpA-like peptidoglycan-associated protein